MDTLYKDCQNVNNKCCYMKVNYFLTLLFLMVEHGKRPNLREIIWYGYIKNLFICIGKEKNIIWKSVKHLKKYI